MSFTPFNEDMVIIQDLNKRPNAIGGLSAAQLQAKFDEAGIKIKEYLNGTLIPELDDEHTETTQAATELDEKIDSRLLIHLVDEGAGDPLPSTQGATAMIHKDYLVAQNALLTVGDLAIGTYTGNICVITAGLDMNREFTVRATGQSILDKVADVASALENEIESVAEAPHVVWCSRTVPTAANPSAQVQIPVQYFAPTPKTGDVVIGVNNRVGRVLVVEESGGVQAATVSGGLGLAISGGLVTSVNGKEGDAWLHPADVGAEAVRTDASEQYAAAHALDASLTPEKFLSQEAEGRYVVVTDDATTYADNIVLETASVSLVQKLTASGAVEQYYYVDEALIWSRTDGDGITQLSNGVKTPIVKALALTVKTDDNHEVSLVSASNGTLLLTRDGTGLVELRNIDTPTTDGSAANKKYVDDNKTTIDDSLSVTGAAADAKTVGDAIDAAAVISELALANAYPGNYLLYDDNGRPKYLYDDVDKPSAYVYIEKFRLCDVLSTDDTRVHPAFIVNGQEIDGFWCGKYQTHNYDGRAYSLPGVNPSDNENIDTVVAYNRAKGGNFHEVTNAEWAAVALWCHKNGCEPYGNNNYGKDSRETLYKAIPSMAKNASGKTQRVATGTGPITWSHDSTMGGIWDMNGNIHEWCIGLRLVKGELQVLPDNDAADPSANLSASSGAWKTINANATAWNDLYLTPDGNGTTQNSVKLDYISGKWKWSTTITSQKNSPRYTAYKDIRADATVSDTAKKLLMALALLPDTALSGDGIAANYSGDAFYANNVATERCILRGGYWAGGGESGVFYATIAYDRSSSGTNIGGRSACYD